MFRRTALALFLAQSAALSPAFAATGRSPVANGIVAENALPGTPPSQWDIAGAGDANIQGFATDISYAPGETAAFKIDTDSDHYKIVIYRLGWYGGMGARSIDSLEVSQAQTQPPPLTDDATGLVDCGNWAVSATWPIPANAVSGIYIAKLVRQDMTPGSSHITFVVRDDNGHSDLLFQTSDTTWQAYNSYGGNSLYTGNATSPPVPRAHKVSYNRPFVTRTSPTEDWLFNAEFPMLRFLERNGYDVSYSTDMDTDRRGSELLEHRVFMSVGHDEYWSAAARANVEAARNAGVHLAFWSGNEIYWKVRWEPSTDGSSTPYRTLVCYKEGTLGEIACGGKCDPLPDVWTGLWRDGCSSSPPADGCRPENALSGQISWDGGVGAIQVPGTFASFRFWRGTSIAALPPNATATLSDNTLGYEWDWQQYEDSYPAGRVLLSTTLLAGRTHHLSLYRHASGALVFAAGTVQWSWGLDGTHDRGSSTPDARMQQATLNILADMGAMPATVQSGLASPTPAADTSPPVSAIGFPVDGGSVPSGVPVTITGTAIEAGGGGGESGGVVAGVEVSVDGGLTWLRASGTSNWSRSWTPSGPGTVTIKTRAVDDLGNLEAPAAGITLAVTGAPPPTCPCGIWSTATVPGTVDAGDASAVELGVKLRSDVDGFISGIRFYKSAANTGLHAGNLWTAGGTPLASVNWSSETASGWQEVSFGTPVAVTAGTTYIASVFMPSGHYSFDGGFFATSGVDNGPLHALQNGVDGPNGVYHYGATGGFPTDSFNSSNYWVDVVFETTSGPDTTPPTVVAITPGSGAVGVGVGIDVTLTFDEAMAAATIDASTFELRDGSNNLVPASVAYSTGTRRASLDPTSSLAYSTTYTARMHGGAGTPHATDLAGNPLATDFSWSFTTGAPPPPPPDEGPGGPILVIAGAGNPFGRYYAEILRTEGLNEFTVTDISLVSPTVLAAYDVVLLAEVSLAPSQVTMLTDWVTGGGNLIAMRPDPQLAALLGITPQGSTLANAYLAIDTASPPGSGLVDQTIQFHGPADRYALAGASRVATLYSTATTASANPAVTLRSVGTSGGHAAAFAFDLARSVVYTRQGNPAWAGQERDGVAPIRSDDLFFGAAASDPQPDWIDLDKVAIPQADEQQRLLANLVLTMNRDRKPLPRFWYFPRDKKAVVVMTGDNHGSGGTAPRFDIYLQQSPAGCSLEDWECVRATSYLYVSPPFTDAQAVFYHNLGFEVGVHVNTGCADWTPASLEAMYSDQLGAFTAAYPSIPAPSTNRTHCIAWSDWATQPRVELAHGIRFDTNYYFWPPGWVQDRPGMFTGSGMPMRFADADGTMIDCYQAPSQMTDESGQSFPFTIDTLLDRALGPQGWYGAFTANMHTDSAPHAGSDAIVASALARGVPVVSARQMLTWLDGRNASSFGNLTWNGSRLDFTIAVGGGARNLRGMLPTTALAAASIARPITAVTRDLRAKGMRLASAGGRVVRPVPAATAPLTGLTRGGTPIAFTVQTIKGIEYALFDATPGSYEATYEADVDPPVITAVTATPGTTSATIAWSTDEPSDSRVDYGTSAATLDHNTSAAALIVSHSLLLTGLSPETTYYYRVTSADADANSATSPAPPGAPASFTTLPLPAGPCASDDTAVEFAAGSTGTDTEVAATDDGEIILAPAAGNEFSGATLETGWTGTAWSAGGSATLSGGQLVLDGARAGTDAAFGPGRGLECVATFQDVHFQHIGFVADFDFNAPWAIFSTFQGGGLYARTSDGTNTLIPPPPVPGTWLGSPHRYRIEWSVAGFDFFIDGAHVAFIGMSTGTSLHPLASDLDPGGPTLSLDWLRLSPYSSAGSFTSRVFDAGTSSTWSTATWSSSTPAGTSLGVRVRLGDTPVPDASWTSFNLVPSSGASVGGTSRYLQYRADLATTDAATTPALQDIAFDCSAAVDLPPLLSAVQATPGPDGMTATVTWTTNEPANSRVDYGTSPGSLTQSATAASFVTAHSIPLSGLSGTTTYYYRVTSADPAAHAATSPALPDPPNNFTTPAAACFVDRTTADFSAGTVDAGTSVSETNDGEIILAPVMDAEFSGAALPADWASFPWGGGGTSTVSGGSLQIDGARANTEPAAGFGPGRALEFVATFAAAPFQHIGFGAGNDLAPNEIFNTAPWAIFSTGAGGSSLLARTWDGGPFDDTAIPPPPIPGTWLGFPHRFRIEWNTSSVDFSIDGTLVAQHAVTIAGPMRPAASDFATGGAVLSVDWIRMTPNAAAGSFTSRVFDAGSPASWATATWTSSVPNGTSLSMSARRGDTASPDGSWTAFVSIPSSGATVGGTSRYIQYRADLATTDPAQTPELADVSIACGGCIDVTPPARITSLAAVQSPGSGDSDGTIAIGVSWPAVEAGAAVLVYRKAFGNYPEYDDGPNAGAAPPAPSTPMTAEASGWTLAARVTGGTSVTDEPAGRDTWYYVAYVEDACNNVSDVSNRTSGTPDYLLGDVSNGQSLTGNNAVSTEDLSALGAHYGATANDPLFVPEFDFGPTEDGGPQSRPQTDNVIDFEELVLLAIGYTFPLPKSVTLPEPASHPVLVACLPENVATLAPGDRFDVELWIAGDGHVQALRVPLGWDSNRVEPLAPQAGPLLVAQGGAAAVLSERGNFDIALLGRRAAGISGEGVIARVTFQVRTAGDPHLSVGQVVARDGSNHRLDIAASMRQGTPASLVVPSVSLLSQNVPNPFNPSTTFTFGVARPGRVLIQVFSVDGRLARTLLDASRLAGTWSVRWDGKDAAGRRMSSGTYLVQMQAPDRTQTRRVTMVK